MSDSSSDEGGTGRSRPRRLKSSKAKSAMEEFRQLKKLGIRRCDQFQLEDEADLYDVVDEEEYNEIVRKRREKGDFVVDDDGTGYLDDGEEHHWEKSDTEYDDEGKDIGKANGKRKLSTSPSERKKKKKKKTVKPITQFQADKEKSQQKVSSLFASIQKKGANTKDAKQEEAEIEKSINDDSLESMLKDLVKPASKYKSKKTKSSKKKKRKKSLQISRGIANVPDDEVVHMDAGDDDYEDMHVHMDGADGDDGGDGKEMENEDQNNVKESSEAAEKASSNHNELGDADKETSSTEESSESSPKPQVEKKLSAKERLLMKAKTKPVRQMKEANSTPIRTNASTFMSTPPVGMSDSQNKMSWNNVGKSAVGGVEESGKATKSDNAKLSDLLEKRCSKCKDTQQQCECKSELETVLKLYWLDIYEDSWNVPGKLFLIGKAISKTDGSQVSCCVEISNISRVLYFLPRERNRRTDEGVTAVDVHKEVTEIVHSVLPKGDGRMFKMKKVKRNYAFELEGVPRGEAEYYKVKYPMAAEKKKENGTRGLSTEITGDTFDRVFGADQSATERFILSRDLMGPGWLEIVNPVASDGNKSWCKFMFDVDDPKRINKITDNPPPIPKLKVLSLALKTIVNKATHAHEVVLISGLMRSDVNLEGQTSDFNSSQGLKYFTALRVPTSAKGGNGSNTLPLDFKRKAGSQKSSLVIQANESALLNFFMAQLHILDPDIILGHNISGFELEVLLTRMDANRVRNWSRVGRLRRDRMPKSSRRGDNGVGKFFGNLTPGRLLLDSYLTAKELLFSQRSYTLTELCRTQLKQPRIEVDPMDVPAYFNTADDLLNLVKITENDAWLTLQLMFKLQAVPLTLQLTNLGGNLWQRTLSAGRAERIEYLLLHEFHRRKYVLPDKSTGKKNQQKEKKKSIAARKKPSYSGGLVLEPKKGLYDTYILLLDFNSLYPSIIQEYNICYTTVQRPAAKATSEGGDEEFEMPSVPDQTQHKELAILPTVIRALVERRGVVKKMMKNEKDATKKQQQNIRQLALKIIANSMYGCLGFSSSRFYAKPLAALVTSQGREVLQNTVDTVTKKGLDVIYGDTDSIMINTNTTDLKEVEEIGRMVKSEINKLYKCLFIEQDGVYKSMLLLKKKKYAALSIKKVPLNISAGGNNEKKYAITTEKEVKGLDLVRRDWAPLSTMLGHKILDLILSGKRSEEIVDGIHELLRNVAAKIRKGEDLENKNDETVGYPLKQFAITKGLNKSPKDYPDAKGQPHLQVALAMLRAGKPVNTGDHIPYVICMQKRSDYEAFLKEKEGNPEAKLSSAASGSSKSYAERAFHPDEVIRAKGALSIDIEWYLATQIMPPCQRLTSVIAGTSPAMIAEMLGLDTKKYNINTAANNDDDDEEYFLQDLQDNKDRYKDCEKLSLKCANIKCEEELKFDAADDEKIKNCPKCKTAIDPVQVHNATQLLARKSISKYYQWNYVADDPSADLRTRQLSVSGRRYVMNGRRVQLKEEYPSKELYTQLKYLETIDKDVMDPILTHSGYSWVDNKLFKTAFKLQ